MKADTVKGNVAQWRHFSLEWFYGYFSLERMLLLKNTAEI